MYKKGPQLEKTNNNILIVTRFDDKALFPCPGLYFSPCRAARPIAPNNSFAAVEQIGLENKEEPQKEYCKRCYFPTKSVSGMVLSKWTVLHQLGKDKPSGRAPGEVTIVTLTESPSGYAKYRQTD